MKPLYSGWCGKGGHLIKFISFNFASKITWHPSGHTTLKWRHINVDATWSRRIDVDTTSFWCCVPPEMYYYTRATFPHQPVKSVSEVAFLHRFHWSGEIKYLCAYPYYLELHVCMDEQQVCIQCKWIGLRLTKTGLRWTCDAKFMTGFDYFDYHKHEYNWLQISAWIKWKMKNIMVMCWTCLKQLFLFKNYFSFWLLLHWIHC